MRPRREAAPWSSYPECFCFRFFCSQNDCAAAGTRHHIIQHIGQHLGYMDVVSICIPTTQDSATDACQSENVWDDTVGPLVEARTCLPYHKTSSACCASFLSTHRQADVSRSVATCGQVGHIVTTIEPSISTASVAMQSSLGSLSEVATLLWEIGPR